MCIRGKALSLECIRGKALYHMCTKGKALSQMYSRIYIIHRNICMYMYIVMLITYVQDLNYLINYCKYISRNKVMDIQTHFKLADP